MHPEDILHDIASNQIMSFFEMNQEDIIDSFDNLVSDYLFEKLTCYHLPEEYDPDTGISGGPETDLYEEWVYDVVSNFVFGFLHDMGGDDETEMIANQAVKDADKSLNEKRKKYGV